MLQPLLPGLLLGLGITLIIAALVPTRPQLADTLHRLTSTELDHASQPLDQRQRIGAWFYQHVPALPGLTTSTRDLDLLGIAHADFYWKKTLLAGFGLIFPSIIGLIGTISGAFSFAVPALLGIPLALIFWLLPDLEAQKKAKAARSDFARAVGTYFELVASERLRGASAGRSLESAAEVADTWIFHRIRQEITRGKLAGIHPWHAVASLSEDIGVPELKDIARIVELSGKEGAEIYEPLRNRGRSLRLQILEDEHAQANKASESMTVPMTLLAAAFFGLFVTPLMFSSFG